MTAEQDGVCLSSSEDTATRGIVVGWGLLMVDLTVRLDTRGEVESLSVWEESDVEVDMALSWRLRLDRGVLKQFKYLSELMCYI